MDNIESMSLKERCTNQKEMMVQLLLKLKELENLVLSGNYTVPLLKEKIKEVLYYTIKCYDYNPGLSIKIALKEYYSSIIELYEYVEHEESDRNAKY